MLISKVTFLLSVVITPRNNTTLVMQNNLLIIKPHHFLDFLYDLATDNRHNEPNPNRNANGELCRAFMDGKITKIVFTPFVDDICRPCKCLVDGKRCIQYFDDETTLLYGFRYKNDFNYQLDIKLNAALPNIFMFDVEQNIIDVLKALRDNLTEEIINLYLWRKDTRVKNTFIGIDEAVKIYQ